jgi:hypothetical protein
VQLCMPGRACFEGPIRQKTEAGLLNGLGEPPMPSTRLISSVYQHSISNFCILPGAGLFLMSHPAVTCLTAAAAQPSSATWGTGFFAGCVS